MTNCNSNVYQHPHTHSQHKPVGMPGAPTVPAGMGPSFGVGTPGFPQQQMATQPGFPMGMAQPGFPTCQPQHHGMMGAPQHSMQHPMLPPGMDQYPGMHPAYPAEMDYDDYDYGYPAAMPQQPGFQTPGMPGLGMPVAQPGMQPGMTPGMGGFPTQQPWMGGMPQGMPQGFPQHSPTAPMAPPPGTGAGVPFPQGSLRRS
ncbi:hypothetical protein [Bacillus alkalicellulosilyticus]|uniref:hypothetical protein n=1 Tax=Alkalihalobacterium alkalicellulosilyticum TaxID=1912214 RepID=UPI000996BEEF|nr:hypothetical protein [Bacillus alkalicellulosilyticus]